MKKPDIIYINDGDNEQTWLKDINKNHSTAYVCADLYNSLLDELIELRENIELGHY